jgi:hypothetical protein
MMADSAVLLTYSETSECVPRAYKSGSRVMPEIKKECGGNPLV